MLCTTSWVQDYVVHHRAALCTIVHKGDLCPYMVLTTNTHRWCTSMDVYKVYSIFVVDNKLTCCKSRFCSSVLTDILVVHNVALYLLGGAQDYFAWSLRTTREMVYNAVLLVLRTFNFVCNFSFHYPGRRTAIIFWAVYHPSSAVK